MEEVPFGVATPTGGGFHGPEDRETDPQVRRTPGSGWRPPSTGCRTVRQIPGYGVPVPRLNRDRKFSSATQATSSTISASVK